MIEEDADMADATPSKQTDGPKRKRRQSDISRTRTPKAKLTTPEEGLKLMPTSPEKGGTPCKSTKGMVKAVAKRFVEDKS